MVFQFASADADGSAEIASNSYSSGGNGDDTSRHVGQWIERMKNVQTRTPQSKRRKLDDEEDPQKGQAMQFRGGTGILASHVHEQRKQANGSTVSQATTVDLTDGKKSNVASLISQVAHWIHRK